MALMQTAIQSAERSDSHHLEPFIEEFRCKLDQVVEGTGIRLISLDPSNSASGSPSSIKECAPLSTSCTTRSANGPVQAKSVVRAAVAAFYNGCMN